MGGCLVFPQLPLSLNNYFIARFYGVVIDLLRNYVGTKYQAK